MGRSLKSGQWLQFIQLIWHWLSRHAQYWLTRLKSRPDSADYLTWRHQFLQKRLRLGLWLALFWQSLVSAEGLYSVLFEFERLRAVAFSTYGDASISERWRVASIVYYLSAVVILLACAIGQKTTWGRRYPEALFLLFACSLSSLTHIIFTFVSLPETPPSLLFLIFAVLVPVHWRLHVIYQAVAIAYYAIFYPITGLATLEYAKIRNLYSRELIIQLACACSISILSVYLYERLKRSPARLN